MFQALLQGILNSRWFVISADFLATVILIRSNAKIRHDSESSRNVVEGGSKLQSGKVKLLLQAN